VTALKIEFIAGRFHATPWGRAVNEGDVEWPPAPWRLLRAIVAAWMRSGERDFDRLAKLCDALAAPPRFDLPPATLSHSRHYMKQGTVASGLKLDTSLVLDAFAYVERGHELSSVAFAIWDDVDLDSDDRAMFEKILTNLTYLGRAESWCEVTISDHLPPEKDRFPVVLSSAATHEGPVVRRLGAMPALRGVELLKALLLPTSEMRASLRTQPNGTVFFDYRFPPQFGMDARDVVTRQRSDVEMPIRVERFVLEAASESLRPSVTETIVVAEAFSNAAMSRSSSREGRVADPILSGKAGDGSRAEGHRHAFYLPRDLDRDGLIDHVDVWFPGGSSSEAHRAVVGVRAIYGHRLDGRFSVTHLGEADRESGVSWVSATPFILERHVKMTSRTGGSIKSDSPEDQVRRSLSQHGFDSTSATFEIADGVQLIGNALDRRVRADTYRRLRHRETGQAYSFNVSIRFTEAITGPLALGRHAHFGLGQFILVRE
jgi:CRISPR-associated protein Csb2